MTNKSTNKTNFDRSWQYVPVRFSWPFCSFAYMVLPCLVSVVASSSLIFGGNGVTRATRGQMTDAEGSTRDEKPTARSAVVAITVAKSAVNVTDFHVWMWLIEVIECTLVSKSHRGSDQFFVSLGWRFLIKVVVPSKRYYGYEATNCRLFSC